MFFNYYYNLRFLMALLAYPFISIDNQQSAIAINHFFLLAFDGRVGYFLPIS